MSTENLNYQDTSKIIANALIEMASSDSLVSYITRVIQVSEPLVGLEAGVRVALFRLARQFETVSSEQFEASLKGTQT